MFGSSLVFVTYVELGICWNIVGQHQVTLLCKSGVRLKTSGIREELTRAIAEPLALKLHHTHGSIGEATTHSTTHDAQPLQVTGQVVISLKQETNVGEGAGGHKPCRVLGGSNQSLVRGL